MTTPETPTNLPDEADGEETSGIMAEAFANLAERTSGVATEAPPDESASDDAAPVEASLEETAAAVEDSLGEVDEDSPFAAAAAIFSSTTEPAVDDAADTADPDGEESTPAPEQADVDSAPETVVEESAPSNRPKTNRPKTNRPKTNRPKTNRPKTNRPKTNRPKTNRHLRRLSKKASKRRAKKRRPKRPFRQPALTTFPAGGTWCIRTVVTRTRCRQISAPASNRCIWRIRSLTS